MAQNNRIRLELEVTKAGDISFPVINLFTGRTPVISRGRNVDVEIVLLDNKVLDDEVANISSICLEIKTYNDPASAPIVSKTILAVDINSGLTDAEREAATNQHAKVTLTDGDTGFSMTGQNALKNKTFSIVITATRNGSIVTLCAGSIIVHDDGGQYSGNTPTAGDATYYTKEETLGLLADNLKIFNEAGVPLILTNSTHQVKLWLDEDNVFRTDVSPLS